MRIDHEIPIDAGQSFQIAGIANLFYSIYGPEYPFDTCYIPDAIIEENRNGNIHSVIARTPAGDIVAHGALYRSSPPYGNLYEIDQYIVLKNYRETFAAYKINQYIAETLLEHVRPAGILGEAVCNHVTTQKCSARIGMKDTALEVDLMPAEVYEKEGNSWTSNSGRVVIGIDAFQTMLETAGIRTAPDLHSGAQCGHSANSAECAWKMFYAQRSTTFYCAHQFEYTFSF
ncbi:MAG: hypothetical protein AB9866_08515 [Syntrophobacteraceae bacterium]